MNNCIPADSKLPEFFWFCTLCEKDVRPVEVTFTEHHAGCGGECIAVEHKEHYNLGVLAASLGLDTEAKIREAAATLEAVKWCIENQYIFYDCDETGNIIVEHLENTANCGAEGQTLPLAVAALKGDKP